MFLASLSHFSARTFRICQALAGFVLVAGAGAISVLGESVPSPSKHIIGPTARFTELSSGITFPARIDTGAKTCSLHVEKIEVKDELPRRLDNVGKKIRFQLVDEHGNFEWVESKVADAVRVRSSVLKDGEYDRRYKVWLTLERNGFSKKVLVTLNDRTNMEFPLLIGRNFLRGDFLVDVALEGDD